MLYLVEIIKWVDSQSVTNWAPKASYEDSYTDDLTVTSVGFVVHESEDRVMILQNNGAESWNMMMCIPKVCIVERINLTRGD